MTTASLSSSETVAVSKRAAINEDRKGIKTCVFKVLRTKIHVKFITEISRNCASENAYNISLLHSDGPLTVKRSKNSCANKKYCRLEKLRNQKIYADLVFGPYVFRLFALSSLANLHHFLICALSFLA